MKNEIKKQWNQPSIKNFLPIKQTLAKIPGDKDGNVNDRRS